MTNRFSGNKGEWSEIYTLFKLLAEGRLYAADSDLNKIDGLYYEIIKIIRNEQIGPIHFIFDGINSTIDIQNNLGEIQTTVPTSTFLRESESLYKTIRDSNTPSFEIVQTSKFMDDILCNTLKSPSPNKSDITIKIHDSVTGDTPTLGFSIKSRLGKPSTLLNAGLNTNFVYEIVGNIDDENMYEINNLYIHKKLSDGTTKQDISVASRINYFKEHDYTLEFNKIDCSVFQNNLILIDADLPKIISYALQEYYFTGICNIFETLHTLAVKNPLKYDLSQHHPFYQYKFKKFLTESALGMLPGKVWSGKADASGGYIIIREDGEVLCYHLYNRNDFEDYLLKNTRFDRGGAGRHQYAVIEKIDSKYYVKLNLQIRFIK